MLRMMMNVCTRLATATLATSLPRGFLLEVLQGLECKYSSGQHMWLLTVRCATNLCPKVGEGDRRNAGALLVRAARALQTLSTEKPQRVGEGRNHCMWRGFYHRIQVSHFPICSVWCVTALDLHNITSSCFPPASDIVLKVLGALLVHCDNHYISSTLLTVCI